MLPITTDIMVGFAGETDEEFAESLAFAEEIAFAKVHVFAYSRRPGTRAYDMGDQLTNARKGSAQPRDDPRDDCNAAGVF